MPSTSLSFGRNTINKILSRSLLVTGTDGANDEHTLKYTRKTGKGLEIISRKYMCIVFLKRMFVLIYFFPKHQDYLGHKKITAEAKL